MPVIRQVKHGHWTLDGNPWTPKVQGFRFVQQELNGEPIGTGYAFVELLLSGMSEDAARKRLKTPPGPVTTTPVGKGK